MDNRDNASKNTPKSDRVDKTINTQHTQEILQESIHETMKKSFLVHETEKINVHDMQNNVASQINVKRGEQNSYSKDKNVESEELEIDNLYLDSSKKSSGQLHYCQTFTQRDKLNEGNSGEAKEPSVSSTDKEPSPNNNCICVDFNRNLALSVTSQYNCISCMENYYSGFLNYIETNL